MAPTHGTYTVLHSSYASHDSSQDSSYDLHHQYIFRIQREATGQMDRQRRRIALLMTLIWTIVFHTQLRQARHLSSVTAYGHQFHLSYYDDSVNLCTLSKFSTVLTESGCINPEIITRGTTYNDSQTPLSIPLLIIFGIMHEHGGCHT